MALIRKIDTIGIKPLLAKGEFGMDMYAAGGDRICCAKYYTR